jgi:hypothetical protein
MELIDYKHHLFSTLVNINFASFLFHVVHSWLWCEAGGLNIPDNPPGAL